MVVPKVLRECVVQVVHGDYARLHKLVDITEHVFWPEMKTNLEKKSANCIVCFKAGRNLKIWLPKTEAKKLPAPETVNQEVQLDFLGQLTTEKGKKGYVLVAIDNSSIGY